MKTTLRGVLPALLLASTLLGAEEAKEPTRKEKADDLAEKMEQMREDYEDLLAECWGLGYYEQDAEGDLVWHLAEAPNAESCEEAETLEDDYRDAYKALLKLDRRRVIFEDIPKYIDRS